MSDPRTPSASRVVVLADSDSRWKWGLHTARHLVPDALVDGVLVPGPSLPSERQLAEVGLRPDSLRTLSLDDALVTLVDEPPDVVIVALPGGAYLALFVAAARAWPRTGPRPVFVAGYVGVVYEKLIEGLLGRVGADLILANSPRDATSFWAALQGVGADPACVATTRLPFLGGAAYRPDPARPYTVTFAAQPGVPGKREEREYVLERLVRHATLHPERDVLIKLRGHAGERLTHAEHYPYQALAPKLGVDRPANLRFVHGRMDQVLGRTDLLLTVSSTAAVEAVHRGVPTGVLTDFGIREGLGNHYFVGAGCFVSFDEVDAGAAPAADRGWALAHGLGAAAAADEARDRLRVLLARDELPPVAPYYDLARAPVLVRSTLARHGLAGIADDDDGRATPAELVRHAVRVMARHAYQQGVHRVAPRLRKLARL